MVATAAATATPPTSSRPGRARASRAPTRIGRPLRPIRVAVPSGRRVASHHRLAGRPQAGMADRARESTMAAITRRAATPPPAGLQLVEAVQQLSVGPRTRSVTRDDSDGRGGHGHEHRLQRVASASPPASSRPHGGRRWSAGRASRGHER